MNPAMLNGGCGLQQMAGTITMSDASFIDLNDKEKRLLLSLARQAVAYRLQAQRPFTVVVNDYGDKLCQWAATFVTIKLKGRLRGCIGALEAHRPLVDDVVANAQSAAFRDPRFEPVSVGELEQLQFEISVLTPPQAMTIGDEGELIAQLRPGEDGLIIQQDGHSATFLPSVWEQLPTPAAFLAQLKRKAGITPDAAQPLQAWRYHTLSFAED